MTTQPAHSLQQRKAMNTTDSIERSTAMNQFSLNPDSRTPDTANPFGFRYDPRGSAMYAPFCALLDTSYSMNTTVGGAVTRFQAAVKSLGASLRRLKEDDVLSDGVHLFLYTFGRATCAASATISRWPSWISIRWSASCSAFVPTATRPWARRSSRR